jgi:hypothetical protein
LFADFANGLLTLVDQRLGLRLVHMAKLFELQLQENKKL